jgi:hypothetical protein
MGDEPEVDLESFLDWFEKEIAGQPLSAQLREKYRRALQQGDRPGPSTEPPNHPLRPTESPETHI